MNDTDKKLLQEFDAIVSEVRDATSSASWDETTHKWIRPEQIMHDAHVQLLCRMSEFRRHLCDEFLR